MKVFFNALVVHLIFNVYVFYRGWKILPEKKAYRVPYAAVFILEFLIYIIGFFVNVHLPDAVLKPILMLGTSWMILIGYIAAILFSYDLLIIAGRWVPHFRQLKLQTFRKRRVSFIVSVVTVVLVMVYGNYRFWNPVVNELNIRIDKEVRELDRLKIVMVSDIHAGYLINNPVLEMYVEKIMEQKPDVILLVGDIIDYDLDPLVNQRMDTVFRKLHAPYGVYLSTGNHEYRLNAEEKIAWLQQKAGLRVLRDEAVKIEDSFYLIGREDDHAPDRKSLNSIMMEVDKSYPAIVMNHEPYNLQEEANEDIDIALYGHTHNGQLFPYNILINMIYEVGYGYKKKENTHVYVSSGLGLSGPQYRIGTFSEIVVLNIEFGNH